MFSKVSPIGTHNRMGPKLDEFQRTVPYPAQLAFHLGRIKGNRKPDFSKGASSLAETCVLFCIRVETDDTVFSDKFVSSAIAAWLLTVDSTVGLLDPGVSFFVGLVEPL